MLTIIIEEITCFYFYGLEKQDQRSITGVFMKPRSPEEYMQALEEMKKNPR